MDFTIELCPIVNRGKSIHKTKDPAPAISSCDDGFTVPLISPTCVLYAETTYRVLVQPIDCDPLKDGRIGSLRWYQKHHNHFDPTHPEELVKIPENSWIFECSIPQGFSEGTCSKCFSNIGDFRIVGNLGFRTDWIKIHGNLAHWQVQRDEIPFPGEYLTVLTVVPGGGDMFVPGGICAPPRCGVPGGSCYFPYWQMQTTGHYYVVADAFFSTPTWTSGEIKDYYTDDLGWSELGGSHLAYPDCSVYGDSTLKYKVLNEGTMKIITSTGFSGYGIGTHVVLRKVGNEYFEPFDDGVVGGAGSLIILPWHIMGNGG